VLGRGFTELHWREFSDPLSLQVCAVWKSSTSMITTTMSLVRALERFAAGFYRRARQFGES